METKFEKKKPKHTPSLTMEHWRSIIIQESLDRHTHTQTNWSENITPPRFRGGVIKYNKIINKKITLVK